MKIDELMMVPWTWQGPHPMKDGGDITHYELRVAELPDFFVAGESAAEVREQAAPALRSFLESYLEAGEVPPLPQQPQQWVWMLDRAFPRVSAPQPPAQARTQRLDRQFQAA